MASPDLHPTDGARFLLQLAESDDQSARYAAAIYTPTDRFDYAVRVTSDGGFEVHPGEGDTASAELEKKLSTMARLIARDAARRAAEGLPAWPQRILRWRGPR